MQLSGSRFAALAGVDAAVLVSACPGTALLHDLLAPRGWLARDGADAAAARLAGAGLWLVAAWVAIGLLAVFAAELPGRCGRLAARVAEVALPRAVLKLVAGAAGLGVLAAPVAATAARAPSAPAWPTSAAPSAPAWPTASASPTPAGSAPPVATPHAQQRPTDRRADATRVRVRLGDSLWSIAAEHLPAGHRAPADVAAAWPRWYSANRHVIGADPDHLEIGEHLVPPPPRHPPTAPRTEPGR